MYSSSFWDTEPGNHLAHVLIRSLPELTEKRKQTVRRVSEDILEYELGMAIREGKRIEQVIPFQSTSFANYYLIICSEPAD